MSALIWGVPIGGGVIEIRSEPDDAAVVVMVLKSDHDRTAAALADVIKVIDAERIADGTSAKFGADLLAAIIRDVLRKHGLYPDVERTQ